MENEAASVVPVSPSIRGRRAARGLGVVFATAAWLVLGACASDVESTGTSISPAVLAQRIQAGSAPLVLDVRTPEEYQQRHIPGAINIPYDQLPARLKEIPDRSAEVVVHCQSGRRAQIAEETLRTHGYSNVRDLAGHWQAWAAAGLPTE